MEDSLSRAPLLAGLVAEVDVYCEFHTIDEARGRANSFTASFELRGAATVYLGISQDGDELGGRVSSRERLDSPGVGAVLGLLSSQVSDWRS